MVYIHVVSCLYLCCLEVNQICFGNSAVSLSNYFPACSSCDHKFFFYYQVTTFIRLSLSVQLSPISIMYLDYGVVNWFGCVWLLFICLNSGYYLLGFGQFGLLYVVISIAFQLLFHDQENPYFIWMILLILWM